MSTEANAQIISVIGGCRRAGRWLVPAKTKVMTFFGSATIDLREAQTTAEELAFDCMSAFASITFIVPEGAEVRPSGMAILASARSDVPVEISGSHLPKIAIDAITLFGRFRIVTGEALEDHDDDAEHQGGQEIPTSDSGTGADLADTPSHHDVPAFVPPLDPAPFAPRDPLPHSPSASEPALVAPTQSIGAPSNPAAGRVNDNEERSPIHDVIVPNSPAAMALDERPAPLPAPDAGHEPGAEADEPATEDAST